MAGDSPGRLITGFVALLTTCVVGVLLYAVVKGVSKDPAVLGSFATALAAVLAVVIGRVREKQLEARDRHRQVIAPHYEELIDRVRLADPDKEDVTTPDFFRELHGKFLLYAPAPVIKSWLIWSRTIPDEAPPEDASPDPKLFEAWERVLLAIRADLGHKDSDLGFGDLQRIYINDADVVFGPFKP